MIKDAGIQNFACSVRERLGLSQPPIDPIQALGAYQLSMPVEPLEQILASAGLSQTQIAKVDAMVDLQEHSVFVKEGMHKSRKNWSYMHELAHHIIPWHRELLYRCSILRLPPALQEQFEREADEFAAEVFFFGEEFIKEAASLPFGLAAPIQLAETRYGVSLHAAFMRYVTQNPEQCCLLVSKPTPNKENGKFNLELQYYSKSKKFPVHFPTHQIVSSNSGLGELFNKGNLSSVVEHEFGVNGSVKKTYRANSFSNGYNVFTLIWNPRTAT